MVETNAIYISKVSNHINVNMNRYKEICFFCRRQDINIRGVIDKFVSFFHRIIIYGWIYIIFCHYQQQSVVNRKKTLKCNVRQICDVTMTLMTSHVGDVVVKTLEDRCGWCTISYMAINAILPVRLLGNFQTIFVHNYLMLREYI